MNPPLLDPALRRAFTTGLIQVLSLLLVIVFSMHALASILSCIRDFNGNDFGKTYYAVLQWKGGGSLYDVSPATQTLVVNAVPRQLLNLNPPFWHLVVWPFTWLSIGAATWMWVAFNATCALVAAVWTFQELDIQLGPSDILPTLAAALTFAATGSFLITAQVTGVLMLMFAQAWIQARRSHWMAAGAWLGLLIALKPFMGLFGVYLVVSRRWGAFTTALSVAATSLVVGVTLFGLSEHLRWADALLDVNWTWAAMNGSLNGLLARTLGPSAYYHPIVISPLAIQVLGAVSVGSVAWFTWRSAHQSIDQAFAVIVLGSLLISPLGWVYYLWLPLGPCLAVWRRTRPVALLSIATMGLALPLEAVAQNPPTALFTVTIGSAYAWGTLLLWLSVASHSSRAPELRETTTR